MWKVSKRPFGGDEYGNVNMEVVGTFNSLYDVAQLFGVTYKFLEDILEANVNDDFAMLIDKEKTTVYYIEGIDNGWY